MAAAGPISLSFIHSRRRTGYNPNVHPHINRPIYTGGSRRLQESGIRRNAEREEDEEIAAVATSDSPGGSNAALVTTFLHF